MNNYSANTPYRGNQKPCVRDDLGPGAPEIKSVCTCSRTCVSVYGYAPMYLCTVCVRVCPSMHMAPSLPGRTGVPSMGELQSNLVPLAVCWGSDGILPQCPQWITSHFGPAESAPLGGGDGNLLVLEVPQLISVDQAGETFGLGQRASV